MKYLLILITIMFVSGCATPLTPEQKLRASVVGEYKSQPVNSTKKYVLLDNGIVRRYDGGILHEETKWSIVEGNIHVGDSGLIVVFRINKDSSITHMGNIVDGKRPLKFGEVFGWTYKKIK